MERDRLYRVVLIIAFIAVTPLRTGVLLSETSTTAIGELRRGEFVEIRGELVRRPDEDELIIQDETGRAEIYLGREGRSLRDFAIGEELVVRGWVDDDRFQRIKEIYAVEIEKSDGTLIVITGEPDEWD
jgi:uncharacterized protein YdeI (BOF family)